ncbi:putative late blight resistance protein homolog R1A-3 [Solanum dulcamara]|uniref:putative late blight resistance protein homolog R1A-3 n=1 Tax=Solanum dulcamara TaxID=45834 RepID=UPI0024869C87|nr:putative late blight resistance protein homolog R1A-3 [Solanum dulcamara]XP_055801806.1 putative late blight resistance protein homolog R1A-3 [Solanum dulcamara]
MAYAALTSAVCSLELFLQCNHPLLNNLQRKDQILSLCKRIIAFQEFLTDYETIKHRHGRLKLLEGKIKEKTYQVEDVVDSKLRKYFLAKNANYRRKAFSVLCRRLQVAIEEMEFIKKEVMKIKGDKISTSKFHKQVLPFRHTSTSSPNLQQEPVGFLDNLEKIIDRLRGLPSELDIITIVGMAGIGKTTLAKRAYNHPSVVYRFDVRAWITVSQEYRERDILFDLFYSVVAPTNEINQESDKEAADKLYGGLMTHSSKEIYERTNQDTADRVYKSLKGRRFLIVVDDMWTTDAWDNVSRLFPDDNKGSRIILTSRLIDVATYANPDRQPHRLNFLNDDEGWELLRQKIFGKRGCPFELEKIGRIIAEKCQGLPLAIVVVAGHLSKMSKTPDCWNTVAESVGSVVNREPGQCLDILALSYNYLPQHLKACFLYMGAFPEDFEIPVWKLIWLWVAEGFLNATGLTTVEELAEECLEDLIDRSLVFAVKRSNGKLKTCKLHDIMRDFCLEEAKRQNVLHVLKHSLDVLSENITALRRVSFNCDTIFSSHPTDPTVSFSRSILGFNISQSPNFSYIDFKLLRVLDITFQHFPQFPSEIMQLVNLRYLAFATSSEFPPAASQFWSLQTLILHVYSRDSTLPWEIWKMQTLRHLHIKPSICLPRQMKEEHNGYNSLVLNNLQTLTNITLADCTTDVFSSIPKLKKLGICETVEYTYPVQIPWSDFLYTSENLWPYCSDTLSDLWLDCLVNLALLPQLETLKIIGLRPPVQVPKLALHLNALPENLKKLTLSFTYLPWESMASLCRLPNLEVLKLKNYAFTGPKWEQVEEGFCSLKLLLIEMSDLKHWSASNDHFPVLEHLVLKSCLRLDSIPHDLGDIPTLQIIELENSSQSAVLSAKEIQEEQQSIGNDTLQVRMERNFGRIDVVTAS